MIPDAMPARSGGIDDIATLVVGDSERPVATAMSSSPMTMTYRGRPMPTMITSRPRTSAVTPASVGRRPPSRAAIAPASGDSTIIGTVNASSTTPARSGL